MTIPYFFYKMKRVMNNMKIGIIGTGAYGLALSLMFYENKCPIKMWTKFEEEKKELEETRQNSRVLPNVFIPNEITFTNNLKELADFSDLIVIAIPAGFVDTICAELSGYVDAHHHICIASKGIEQDTCLFVTDVLEKYIHTNQLAVISGPSFAIDIASHFPIGLTLATKNQETEALLKSTLQNKSLKLRTTDDIIGTEICGSIKNVIAIAAGMLDGMGVSDSTQAMFITESLHDIKALIKALGGNGKTILSFAGFGDLLLTSTSTKSRNFRFGKMFGSKQDRTIIEEYKNHTTIEGLYTLKSIYQLLGNKKIELPIIDLIYDIVFHERDCQELLTFLIEKE